MERRHAAEERVLEEHGLDTLGGYLAHWAGLNRRVLDVVPPDRRLVVRTDRLGDSAGRIARFVEDRSDGQEREAKLLAMRGRLLSLVRLVATGLRPFCGARGCSLASRRALIVPPGPVGSLGDEAMALTAYRGLRALGYGSVSVAAYLSGEDQVPTEPDAPHVDISRLVSHRGPSVAVALLRMLRGFDDVFLLGADVLDGFYSVTRSKLRLALMDFLARCGKRVSIIGFSFRSDASPVCVRQFRNLPAGVRVGARDPVSRRRLVAASGRPVSLTADLAFLLVADATSPRVLEAGRWIEPRRRTGGRFLGVNANYLHAEALGDPHALTSAYARELSRLMEEDTSLHVVLIPHDRRGDPSDAALLDTVRAALSPALHERVLRFPEEAGPTEVKALCAQLDLVLTGRMHLAIDALGSGTPIACLTYQGKFAGLFEHFGISDVAMDPREALRPGALADLVRRLLRRLDELSAAIRETLPRVELLSAKNLQLPFPSGDG